MGFQEPSAPTPPHIHPHTLDNTGRLWGKMANKYLRRPTLPSIGQSSDANAYANSLNPVVKTSYPGNTAGEKRDGGGAQRKREIWG